MKAVYTIVERKGSDRKLWIRIGTAFTNKDGSLNLRMDALPVNGELHIRDAEPKSGKPDTPKKSESDTDDDIPF